MRTLLLIVPTVLMLTTGAAPTADGTADSAVEAPVSAGSAGRAGPAPTDVRYRLPLNGSTQVLRGFDPPQTRYGAGHLGVDLRAGPGPVLAAGPGRVTFAGSVAGRGVVVIAHPDGVSTEYEPVRPAVRVGQSVAPAQPIGTVDGVHRGCAGRCLHWGARRGGVYVDPMDLLRTLGTVRLLPWNPGRSRAP